MTFTVIVFFPCAVFEVQFSVPSVLFLLEARDAGTDHTHLKLPDEHQVPAHPEIILNPLYLFHFCTKEESQSRNYALDSYPGCSFSQRLDQLWLWNISRLQPHQPKLGAAWMQPVRIYIFIRFFFPFPLLACSSGFHWLRCCCSRSIYFFNKGLE